MIEFAINSTAPASALIQPYRPLSGASSFPPSIDKVSDNVIASWNRNSTSPSGVFNFEPVLILITSDGQQIVLPKFEISDKSHNVSVSESILTRLDQIKTTLALSITQTAELFSVTRKSVYDWYEGAEPRPLTAIRINALAEVVSLGLDDIDIKKLKSVWKTPVGGQSFLMLMNDERLSELNLQQALRDKLYQLSSRLCKESVPDRAQEFRAGRSVLADIERAGDFS